jgi:uncharacterized protein YjbI with pentapeptide repeats
MDTRMATHLIEQYCHGQRDFRYWDLRGVALAGAALEHADLSWTLLQGADLTQRAGLAAVWEQTTDLPIQQEMSEGD